MLPSTRLRCAALAVLLTLTAAPAVLAQPVVEVEPGFGTLNDAVTENTEPGTVFQLQRGATYFTSSDIENQVPIVIEAVGEGARPIVQPGLGAGGTSDRPFAPGASLTLRGLFITNDVDGGGIEKNMVRLDASAEPGTRVVIEDCVLTKDTQSAIRIGASGTRLFLRNSIIKDIGSLDDPNNGRAIDPRGNDLDSLVIEGSTFYNLSSTILRYDGGTNRYIRVTNNTAHYIGQYLLDLGAAEEVVVQDNLFMDSGYEGTSPPEFFSDGPTPLLRLDSLDGGQYTFSNLNFFLDTDELVEGREPTTFLDETVTATIEAQTGAAIETSDEDPCATSKAAVLLCEEVTFANAPNAPFDFGGEPFDFSYAETAASFTAATDGGPLGDRRYFDSDSDGGGGFEPPTEVSIAVNTNFGDATQTANYELVALPGQSSRDLGATLRGTAGEDWTAYRDDGSDGDDPLVAYDGSEAFRFAPGRGFWLISRTAWDVSETVDAVELSDDFTYAIPLQSGWNIISNPFGVDVAWSDVQAENGVTQPLWAWNGSFAQEDDFTAATTGEAFYFFNDGGLSELVLPYPGAPGSEEDGDTSAEMPAPALTLTAFAEGRRGSAIAVGFAPRAADGPDALDQPAPPGRFEAASLRLTDGRAPALATEYRAAATDGEVFDLALRADGPVELRAGSLARLGEREAWLVESATARAYDLRARPSVTVQATDGAPARFTLLVGSRAFVEHQIGAAVPEQFSLAPAYPNPFRQQATVKYALPETARVRLDVYDALGRRVATLVDAAQPAGRHTATLDARRLAPGVYFYRLTAGTQSATGRVVLVR